MDKNNKPKNSFLSYNEDKVPDKKLNFTREPSKPVATQRKSDLFSGGQKPQSAPRKPQVVEKEEPVTIASILAKKILGTETSKPEPKPVKEKVTSERLFTNKNETLKDETKKIKKPFSLSPATIAKRIGAVVGGLLAIILVFLIGVLLIVNRGPSIAFRDQFVMTVSESSAGDFLATWFLPEEVIDQILEDNSIKTSDDITSGDGVVVATPAPDQKPFEIVDVSGKTFTGKMIIVADPSRVKIGTPPGGYGEDKAGMSTIDMAKHYNALAAVNGGGFYDTGKGNGGVPTGRENSSGIVISGGKMLWGSKSSTYEVIGINKENKLVLGKMTGQQALDAGIMEALNFGPYLIMDGEPCVIGSSITEGGLNPRTAIGQRKDGAMLLLVINGRQANSLGASYDDLISVMLEFGAVNAANMDGGSSSYMVYENEIITTCASLYGPRKMATSILVTREGGN